MNTVTKSAGRGKRAPTSTFTLEVPAGKAVPSQKLGSAFGQRGLNVAMFCKDVNAKTQNLEPNTPVRVLISVYSDKSFDVTLCGIPVSYQIKAAAKITKGSATPGRGANTATLPMSEIEKIAVNVQKYSRDQISIESAVKMVIGSAKSVGVGVVSADIVA